MTRLNLSELAKQRLEKSHLRYEYKHDNNIGRIVSTYPDYKGDEYVVCYHYKKDGDILENKIENEFPQFISSVNVFRNLKSDESFKKFGSLYNFETGVTKMTMWGNNGADLRIELNCDEVSFGDIGLNVNVAFKKENEGTFKTSKLYSDIPENIVLNDEYFKEEKHVEKVLNTDNFNILNCRDYEQKYSINMKRSKIWDAAINREKWMNMNSLERYEYANDPNNKVAVDTIKTTEIATYSTSLPIKGLLHADTKFLNKSLDYFKENGKFREFEILFDEKNKRVSEIDIKQMLLDENVLDNKLYKEFQAEYIKEENNLLDPSEQDFINAINEVNECFQGKREKSLEEEEIDRRFRAVMSKMHSAIIKAEYEEEQSKKSNDQGLIR
jgi:hypothetical protein